MKPPELTNRFDLDDVIAPSDLHEIVKSLSTCSGLSAGIVRMPHETRDVPTKPNEFHLWRLTPVEPEGSPFRFCEIVRKNPTLDFLCMWSDLRFAEEARKGGEPLIYNCVPAGLIDVVAPIEVAGRHVANIYVGRARPKGSTFESHYEQIVTNLKKHEVPIPKDLHEQLEKVYEELPVRSQEDLEKLKPLLASFAELLSQRANRQVLLKVVEQIGHEIAFLQDENLCVKKVYNECSRILNFDTGSVFLLHDTGKKAFLEQALIDWNGDQPKRLRFNLYDKGLIPKIARNAIEAPGSPGRAAILCRTRPEMDAEVAPGFADSRKIRRIQSFLGVPIMSEKHVLGVIEIGAKQANAFSEDDRHLLQAIANYLGISIRACHDRSYLTAILAQTNHRALITTVTEYLPKLTNGIGCSIFLREQQDPQSEAVSLASTELPKLIDKASYTPGEGLTGWVLKTGRLLNIPGGKECRSSDRLRSIDSELTWLGKYKEEDKSGVDFRNRAFLACPIRNTHGDIIGVIRIGARSAGNFSMDDERAIRACSDAIGSVVERAGHERTVHEIRKEIRSLRNEVLAGQRTILMAIRQSPYAFVLLASKAGFVVCALSLALFCSFKLRFIEPNVSLFGCFAFASYWLMAQVGKRVYRQDIASEPKVPEK